MAPVRKSESRSINQLEAAVSGIRKINTDLRLASAPVKIIELTNFDYMFPELQSDPDALLPEDKPAKTVENLIKLGLTMRETGDDPSFDSTIPAAYTYFGQFVSHDITLELESDEISNLNDPELKPLSRDVIRSNIKNRRTPFPDLDSVYGVTRDGTPVPRVCSELVVSPVSRSPKLGPRPSNKDMNNDVPRRPRSEDPMTDREALIGDARNDENLILSQMHVAFLRAHRSLLRDRGLTFNEARKTLAQHFQWLIIDDFLKTIAGEEVVNNILTYGFKFYRPPKCGSCACIYMPLEFSVAAYRFGHSMVRSSYDYNDNFRDATLNQLFSLTAFSGELDNFEHVPESWIIQWEKFLHGGNNARKIDTRIVEPLYALPGGTGRPEQGAKSSLAVRNLLRGYLLRMPVGQRVAQALGIPVLTRQEIERVASEVSQKQVEVLQRSKFIDRTPLWYYILAESAARSDGGLGPVGGTIVAETLIGLVRWSEDSILSQPGWRPTLGPRPGSFTLKDFFSLAGVWG
jgi:hypothetical protein